MLEWGSHRVWLTSLAAATAIACGDDAPAPAPAGQGGGGAATCPDGLAPVEPDEGTTSDAPACAPLVPADCAVGTLPSLADAACRPVGWTECPAGFTLDLSGWACVATLAAEPCEGATRDALGSATCVPIGDCGAAFPPSGATHFVDAAFTPEELDSTHFESLDDAVAAAPAGSIVAVEAGTYAGTLSISKALTIVGRCAAEVRLAGPVVGSPGVIVAAGGEVALSGVTIAEHDTGVWVDPGGSLTLADAVLEDNLDEGMRLTGGEIQVARSVIRGTVPGAPDAQTLGLLAYGGARVTLEDTAITANVEAGIGLIDAGTELAASRLVVRRTTWQGTAAGGMGIKAFDGSRLVLTDTAIDESHTVGLLVGGPGTTAEASHLVVSRTLQNPVTEELAWAVSVRLGAHLDLANSTLVDNAVISLSADEASTVDARGVTILRTRGTGWLGVGVGSLTASGSQVALTESAIVESTGLGAMSDFPGSLVTFTSSLVTGTLPSSAAEGSAAGRGGTAVGAIQGGAAVLIDSAVVTGAEAALAAHFEGSSLALDRVLVDGTAPNTDGLFGHGVLIKDGAVATVRGSYLRAQSSAALVFAGGSGWVDATFVEGNAIGIHVQGGTTLVEQATAPGTITPGQAIVSGTAFWNNGARVGSGEIPVPDLFASSP